MDKLDSAVSRCLPPHPGGASSRLPAAFERAFSPRVVGSAALIGLKT